MRGWSDPKLEQRVMLRKLQSNLQGSKGNVKFWVSEKTLGAQDFGDSLLRFHKGSDSGPGGSVLSKAWHGN